MRGIKEVLYLVGFVAAVALITLAALYFDTVPDVYLIRNPTQAQVEAIVQGDPSSRVWFDDAAQLYQGSSLIKVSLKARYFERDRISNFLDELGVEYELIKKGQ